MQYLELQGDWAAAAVDLLRADDGVSGDKTRMSNLKRRMMRKGFDINFWEAPGGERDDN